METELNIQSPVLSYSENVAIVRKEIEKMYISEIKNNVGGRGLWKSVGDYSETSSMVLSGAASVLAFATGFFDLMPLAFASGCMSTMALAFLTFSAYAHKESKERTARLNKTLETMGVEPVQPTPAAQEFNIEAGHSD
jgi:hypothetical protein